MVQFLKTGDDAVKAFNKEEERKKKREDENAKNFIRFFLKKDQATNITFLDGDLNSGGTFNNYYYEHSITPPGADPKTTSPQQYVCVQEDEPCPLCESGNTARFTLPLTVIDHTEYKDKQNKVHKNQKKLYIAPPSLHKDLMEKAKLRNGLTLCQFQAKRLGVDFEPRVGKSLEYLKRFTKEEFVAEYGEDALTPLDYNEYLPYVPAEELRKMGYGSEVVDTTSVDDIDADKDL